MDAPATRIRDSAARTARALGLGPDDPPRAGLVLGSGLGPFADTLDDRAGVATADVGFPASTVAGHAGELVRGRIGDVPVVVLRGRVHAYEGYDLDAVTHAVRVMAELGVRGVVLTNAAGAMRSDLRAGSLMLVVDHINLAQRRLVLAWDVSRHRGHGGERTAGLAVYSPRLAQCVRDAAHALGIPLREGTLVWSHGPTYETAAEVAVFRRVGGDAGCMSTVPEAVAAASCGLEVTAISCISNLGTGLSPAKLTHEEVTEIAGQVSGDFRRLLSETVTRAFPPEVPS